MKPSKTVTEALVGTETLRTSGDINKMLANVALAILRKEISRADVEDLATVTTGMNTTMLTSIKMMRATMDMQRAAGEKVKLVELGQQVFTGEHQ